ncbi:hypothetical protein LA6_003297 [Marinibacterium anthonyi]|nr:hypothetical protein LA6_003297 [Marinibacterium anthonyi]
MSAMHAEVRIVTFPLPDPDGLTLDGLTLDGLTLDGLTRSGLAPRHRGRILLLACGALAREILDLIALNGWDHLDLACLPAILHNHPDRIPAAVEDAVARHRADYDNVFVVYADCGTGGRLQALCDQLGVEMVEGPHCYSFFEGNAAFAARAEDEFTAFYLTDFLVRQFDAFVWKPLGLDRHPALRDMYFGHYTKLVYQAQTEDADLTDKAHACAVRLGLAFERRFTGYGDLAPTLARL